MYFSHLVVFNIFFSFHQIIHFLNLILLIKILIDLIVIEFLILIIYFSFVSFIFHVIKFYLFIYFYPPILQDYLLNFTSNLLCFFVSIFVFLNHLFIHL
jgi:hypothetical protein